MTPKQRRIAMLKEPAYWNELLTAWNDNNISIKYQSEEIIDKIKEIEEFLKEEKFNHP